MACLLHRQFSLGRGGALGSGLTLSGATRITDRPRPDGERVGVMGLNGRRRREVPQFAPSSSSRSARRTAWRAVCRSSASVSADSATASSFGRHRLPAAPAPAYSTAAMACCRACFACLGLGEGRLILLLALSLGFDGGCQCLCFLSQVVPSLFDGGRCAADRQLARLDGFADDEVALVGA